MPKRIRVHLALPSGRRRFVSLSEATELVARKAAVWIEENVSASLLAEPQSGWFDCAGALGPHCEWRPRRSGGAIVMQLV